MSGNPQNAPAACPGTDSSSAGKAPPCQGCPNQNTCASGVGGPDPAIESIKQKLLGSVKHKIIILSGKGGVGKSFFTAHLGFALASESIINVCILDIDVCGPSMPTLMGLEGEEVHQSGSGWSPVYVSDNLSVMSIGFLLGGPDDAVVWRGPRKNGIIKQFLQEVDWGTLDFLLVDTPPGTSDEHLSIVQYLSEAGVDGAIILTTPQEVSLLDVRKEINFCKQVDLPVIGVVENMSSFSCPKCNKMSDLFPLTTGGATAMCKQMDVPFLGKIPLDPVIGHSCDSGISFLLEKPDSPTSKAFLSIVAKISNFCSSHER